MNTYLIEPRDPLIARDGRPAGIGGAFSTLRFPPPSVLAGAVRSRMAMKDGEFDCAEKDLDALLEIAVQGPLLAGISEGGDGAETSEWFFPAPRDAAWFPQPHESGHARRLAVEPVTLEEGERISDLELRGLRPVVSPPLEARSKPLSTPPAFWRWSEFERWLTHPERDSRVEIKTFGLGPLDVESRSHVALAPGERVGVDGQLFTTRGLRFLAKTENGKLAPRRLALSLRTAGGEVGGNTLKLPDSVLAPLGGDRRLARWRHTSTAWPSIPEAVQAAIVATKRARLVLATPAWFADGAIPRWSGQAIPGTTGVEARVVAAAVARPEVISGWDFRAANANGRRGRPKPTRRLAPAGSVYWLELEGSEQDLAHWCQTIWLQPVSDDDPTDGVSPRRCRLDGFGLATLGVWTEEKP